jgi:hypothetical protein
MKFCSVVLESSEPAQSVLLAAAFAAAQRFRAASRTPIYLPSKREIDAVQRALTKNELRLLLRSEKLAPSRAVVTITGYELVGPNHRRNRRRANRR